MTNPFLRLAIVLLLTVIVISSPSASWPLMTPPCDHFAFPTGCQDPNAVCHGGICVCQGKSPFQLMHMDAMGDHPVCLEYKAIGDSCQFSAQCLKNDHNSRCAPRQRLVDNHLIKSEVTFYRKKDTYKQVLDGVCECNLGHYLSLSDRVCRKALKLSEHCILDEECEASDKNSACLPRFVERPMAMVNHRCGCKASFLRHMNNTCLPDDHWHLKTDIENELRQILSGDDEHLDMISDNCTHLEGSPDSDCGPPFISINHRGVDYIDPNGRSPNDFIQRRSEENVVGTVVAIIALGVLAGSCVVVCVKNLIKDRILRRSQRQNHQSAPRTYRRPPSGARRPIRDPGIAINSFGGHRPQSLIYSINSPPQLNSSSELRLEPRSVQSRRSEAPPSYEEALSMSPLSPEVLLTPSSLNKISRV